MELLDCINEFINLLGVAVNAIQNNPTLNTERLTRLFDVINKKVDMVTIYLKQHEEYISLYDANVKELNNSIDNFNMQIGQLVGLTVKSVVCGNTKQLVLEFDI